MKQFEKLGLIEPILKAIDDAGFDSPTEIQAKSIPTILSGKDVIGGSATGSGKTLAFGSAIIQNSEPGTGIQALVLTPTRELAEQVSAEIKKFARYKRLKILPVYGGVSINPQIDKLESADVVVGTPGRVLDHISRKTIDLSNVRLLVLDEADRMLDMGFIDDVEKITKRCPKDRQTLLYSATISKQISKLSKKYMKSPESISVESHVDPRKLKQVYYDINKDNLKFSLLVHLLKHEHPGLIMVFCNTQRNTDFVANNLKAQGIDAMAIHGGYTQDKRSKIMKKFNGNSLGVLVCTDVAARGLDIKGVSHVYNYDVPSDDDTYIHRIGRTARAGSSGMAINILSSRDYDMMRRISANDAIRPEREDVPEFKKVSIEWKNPSRSRGPGRGKGPRSNSSGKGPKDKGGRRPRNPSARKGRGNTGPRGQKRGPRKPRRS